MKSKLKNFYLNCINGTYDIIIITETWLNSSVHDAEICPPDYNLYRLDRNPSNSVFKNGGGVLIAVKCCLKSELLFSNKHTNLELVTIKINYCHSSFVICGIYVPSGSSPSVYELYSSAISDFVENSVMSNIFIFGDFNLTNL